MADEDKKLPLQVCLRNDSDETYIDRADDIPYIFKAGQEIPNVPIDIAGHFVGRHKVGLLINPPMPDTPKSIRKEEQRVIERVPHGSGFSNRNPLTIVEIVDPNVEIERELKQVVSVPVPVPVEEAEVPFASVALEEKTEENEAEEADGGRHRDDSRGKK
jgi:hypothetical protein